MKYNSLLELDDLKDALDFIIEELKRQEFSELYGRAGSGLDEAILRATAALDQHEISVRQVSNKLKINEKTISIVMGDLAAKCILMKVSRGIFKLHDPLFKIYLRWVLDLG